MTTDDKPRLPLSAIFGHPPTDDLRAVLRHLRGCSLAELNWLKMDGLREVQRQRIESLPIDETEQ